MATSPLLIAHWQDLHWFWQCPLGRNISCSVLDSQSLQAGMLRSSTSLPASSPGQKLCATLLELVAGASLASPGVTPLFYEWMLRRWLPLILLACPHGMEALSSEPAWVKATRGLIFLICCTWHRVFLTLRVRTEWGKGRPISFIVPVLNSTSTAQAWGRQETLAALSSLGKTIA